MIKVHDAAKRMSAINGSAIPNCCNTIKNLLQKTGSTELLSFDYTDGVITINGNSYCQNSRGHWVSKDLSQQAPAPKSVTPQCADPSPRRSNAPLATLKSKTAGFFKPDKVAGAVDSDLTMLLDFTTIPSEQDYATVQYQPRQFEVISGTSGMGVVVTDDTDPCTTQQPDFIESESEFVDYDTALIKYAGLLVDIGHDQDIADNTALLMIDLLRQSIADTEYVSTYKIESLVTMTVELNGETARVIYDPRAKCFVPLEI
ncbi:hypothetical protein [Aeromonas hydrophila]|uniref:hypothetical protein n=1 Tax=Aeromonas hydrophila TaxID=644 RepID=UPI000B295D7D|nr:hypothetical protein [Aeromonas hydrophila]EGX6957502.1 hypothetical protein [Aeromonas hydrophila]MCA4697943.1 hypothetical protein [Aeromonas hydrophila]MCO4221048.1 hypothetical protein [Aeromonas hydrophila]QIO18401.1 hypothetical protein G9455_11350 [Aeromonas hydrophila]USJ78818.1 hypothetical protein LDP97_07180 [Aeromonas hydrophila]